MRVLQLPKKLCLLSSVPESSLPVASGALVHLVVLSKLLWWLLPSHLVLHQNHLHQQQSQAKMLPRLTTLLMVNIFSMRKIFGTFDLVISLVVQWGLVVGDGEPFDIELYPPGLDAAHQLMSKEELQHMFGVDQPHMVDHTR